MLLYEHLSFFSQIAEVPIVTVFSLLKDFSEIQVVMLSPGDRKKKDI
jgi:hypothetical protein